MTADRARVGEDRILAMVLGDEDDTAAAEAVASERAARKAAREYAALERMLGGQIGVEAVRFDGFGTPFGRMWVAATDKGVARVSWHARSDGDFARQLEHRWPDRPVIRDAEGVVAAREQLERYFRGELDRFDLAIDISDLPAFQRSVLNAVRKVPFGQVVPYGELARRIRKPSAARAVGNALGANPVAIVVPCHRVVRGDGKLGGYGFGVEYKQRLLTLEGCEDLLRAG
jgi:O-6-methylguanine DNA methyltransferase